LWITLSERDGPFQDGIEYNRDGKNMKEENTNGLLGDLSIPHEYVEKHKLSPISLLICGIFFSTGLLDVDTTPDIPYSEDPESPGYGVDLTGAANFWLETDNIVRGIKNIINFSEEEIWKSLEELDNKHVFYFNFSKNKSLVVICSRWNEDYLHWLQMHERHQDIQRVLEIFPHMKLMEMTEEE
jgi:hypothetical protein